MKISAASIVCVRVCKAVKSKEREPLRRGLFALDCTYPRTTFPAVAVVETHPDAPVVPEDGDLVPVAQADALVAADHARSGAAVQPVWREGGSLVVRVRSNNFQRSPTSFEVNDAGHARPASVADSPELHEAIAQEQGQVVTRHVGGFARQEQHALIAFRAELQRELEVGVGVGQRGQGQVRAAGEGRDLNLAICMGRRGREIRYKHP